MLASAASRALGLLLDAADTTRTLDLHHAETMRLVRRHLRDRHGDCGIALDVRRDERPVVHAHDVIAGQHQHALGPMLLDPVPVLRDRVGGTAIPARVLPGLVRLQDGDASLTTIEVPRTPRTDVVVERGRGMLREHTDTREPGVAAVAQDEVDDAVLATERQRAHRAFIAQHAERLSTTAREDQGEYITHGVSPEGTSGLRDHGCATVGNASGPGQARAASKAA
jgi:hypothetical protein